MKLNDGCEKERRECEEQNETGKGHGCKEDGRLSKLLHTD